MAPAKRIVIVAGEESGDLHAASFVRILKKNHPHIDISGIGGRHMASAGVRLISDLAKHGVTGGTEIIRHLKVIYQAQKAIKAHLRENKPDLLILVDYPGFNLRLAAFAKQTLGIRVLYYISPQIWGWKPGRINTIRANVDRMAVILPFEKQLYQDAGVPVSFVGHPLMNKISPCKDTEAARQSLGLPTNKRIVAMLPGSRRNEIEYHMPVLVETAKRLCHQFNDLHITIPVAGTIDPQTIASYFKETTIPYTLISGEAVATAACSDCIIVASGTASLECALLLKPMCIIYKVSTITYALATQFIRVKYLGLCNLLQQAMIVPELLQYDCNPDELTRTAIQLLDNTQTIQAMNDRLKQLKLSLSSESADCSIADLILSELNNHPSSSSKNTV
jgi:lipid-A-disaccharide synthase